MYGVGIMDIQDRVACFSEQIMCGAEIYTWEYDADIRLLHSNCPKEEMLDAALEAFGGKELLRGYLAGEARPIVISVSLGLMWCAAASKSSDGSALYVVGPVWSTDANLSGGGLISMENAEKTRDADMAWMRELSRCIYDLPVVMPKLIYQYALMLHCCVNQERVSQSDLIYEEAHSLTSAAQGTRDRYRTWNYEQSLLQMVTNGDLGYKKAFSNVSNVSNGVPVQSQDPLRQAKTSVIVFTSLCTRAAIQGGLSPEVAYTLGDNYIQSVENCTRVTEIGSISYAMYSDFVERVHTLRIGKTASSLIRSICEYVELHAEERFSLEDLAKRTGYSTEHMSRKFKAEMGCSLPDYIRAVRMERAKTLLANGDIPIQEIAETLQFSSRGHFSDVFRKTVGQSPAEYRRVHAKK